ncbi:matrixin family metalloprotease [Capilliphycus salinus ALCB114379]|uniref:matrixin family metalloprotease n=1 Tax=Capilliphycus salinus TaxID=2768948 RepID=UPI0039A6C8CC
MRSSHKPPIFLGLAIAILCIGLLLSQPTPATEDIIPLKPHPLPTSLAQWEDLTQSGDYFDQIEALKVGYLVWSQLPIKVYIEQPTDDQGLSWFGEIASAVEAWKAYLPLEIVADSNLADIQIFRRRPPLEPGNLRASSAETRYQVFVRRREDGTQMLSHRFIIWLSPTQTGKYISSAARHELGHALGIWGHSPTQTDVMYFAQVREPPPISPRDINTLKRIYSQPTRLGWPVTLSSQNTHFP